MSGKSSNLARFWTDYGMLLVLFLLCAFFSAVTYTEQQPTGETAAQELARDIVRQAGSFARVLIVVREQVEDAAFATALEAELKKSGATIAAVTKGEPTDARAALQRLASAGVKLDVIAANRATATWSVFDGLAANYPALGTPQVMQPRNYKWPNFLKRDNLLNIANQIAVIAIVAIGMTMVIITGGIDLSVGSLIALSAVLVSLVIREWFGGLTAGIGGMVVASLVAILTCGLVGGFSGAMVTLFGIPPFIVTLSMMLVASGSAFLLSHGQSVYEVPASFRWLGGGADFLNLPNAVVLMALLYVAAHILMTRLVLGRYFYAVGGNRVAARFSGVPVKRVLLVAYIASGLLAGLGGVILASQLKSGAPTYGTMYELKVIAAVVVGGASLSGGSGRMVGTLIGAFTIAVIENGMNLTNVESYTQKVVLGLVILAAVFLDLLRQRGWRGMLRHGE